MSFLSKLRRYIRNPYAVFVYLGNRGALNWMSDRAYLKLVYRGQTGQRLNLKSPQTFNEKLQWLKLHDRNPRYTVLVDKFLVKEEVKRVLGSQAIVPTLGAWSDAEEIDFDRLPNTFVLKANHNSGGVIICRDKSSFDTERATASMLAQLNRSYFWPTREWPYRDVRPVVFAEEYLPDDEAAVAAETDGDADPGDQGIRGIIDYKFYCFHGEPQFLYVARGLEDHSTARVVFLSLDWEVLGFGRSDYAEFVHVPPKPEGFTAMVAAARLLSAGIPFVRVDLFEHRGVVLFSEMTFHPVSGMMPFLPAEADAQVGALLDLGRVSASP